MYCLVVYDVDIKRVDRVHKFLRQYLFWVQNSVFEGELTLKELREITERLKSIIDESHDSVVIYTFKHESVLTKMILGQNKNKFSNIL